MINNGYQFIYLLQYFPDNRWFRLLWSRYIYVIENYCGNLMAYCNTFSVKLVHYLVTGNALLSHWGQVTHICVSNLTIIGSDHGLSPGRRQAIIWTNAGILLIRSLGTNFSEVLFEMYIFSLKKCIWKCRQEVGGHFVSASCAIHNGCITRWVTYKTTCGYVSRARIMIVRLDRHSWI